MAYQRETFAPTRHRVKTTPNNSDLIQKGNTIHAFLAKVRIPLDKTEQTIAGKGFYNEERLNRSKNVAKNSRFDLWITEATYGYSAVGPTAVSKYYTRTYTHSFKLTPASVQGICRDENEYDDLADFIREGQIAVSQNPENVFRLYIPGAKIDYIGVIESFQGGIISNNKGLPVAPRFKFDFTIFKDLNDNVQQTGMTASTIIYNFDTDAYWNQKIKDYKNDYIVGQLIDKISTDDPKSEVNGFNRSIYAGAQAAANTAGTAANVIGSVFEGLKKGLGDLGGDIENNIGRLF